MEYGIFVSDKIDLPPDPRSYCAGEWLHVLPAAPLRAVYFGSEFCPELLPDPSTAERLCLWALELGLEPVLLTPIVTSFELTRLELLLQSLAERGVAPAVVFNDWGVMDLLRGSFPGLGLRAGRLINRGLRDPRLLENNAADPVRGEAGKWLRSLLLRAGVSAVETDPDLEGGYLGKAVPGVQRVLHFPFAAAASGRNCLVKADAAPSAEACFTKGLASPCAAHCRGRSHPVSRGDSGAKLWRGGNTVFYEVPPGAALDQLARADRVVLYRRAGA